MTNEIRKILVQRFTDYVDTFRDSSGQLSPMLQLKLTHTMHVVKDAKSIMECEGWRKAKRPIGEVCALLHDIGRFSQFKEFGTFQDSLSIDHAERGIEIMQELNILQIATPSAAQQITDAIQWHNKKELPDDMDAETRELGHLVRDADKLDIFRVIETAIEDGTIDNTPEITWGLDIKGHPNQKLVNSILKGQPVDYSHVHSLSDFILIQVGWVISGFHNKSALNIIKERNVVEFRRKYLKKLTNDNAIDLCCNAAESILA
ncbi:MAG: HD domain-containing protein [Kiritimatiellae bacterium]|jgi:putative nucleotidyltransferase with HDIG domain|nr:HD domain-containing protein [Kiritimatiellia bacterium]